MTESRAGTQADAMEANLARTATAHRLLVWEPASELHDALRLALGHQSELWETTFVRSAEQVRAAMANVHFDVVLADAEAAGPMASLLAEIGLRAPWALRVVMGSNGDEERMVDAISAAHRFVARPVDLPILLDDLAATIRRRSGLRDVDALRLAFADNALPAAPGIWMQLSAALADPEFGAAEMGAIVEADVAVAAKALSLANSAWFGLPRRVTDVRDAVVLLGGEAVQAIVLAAELAGLVGSGVEAGWMQRFEAHAAQVAQVARRMAPPALRRSVTGAALLHDVGSLVLMRHHQHVMLATEGMDLDTRLELERELVGATHSEIGAMLLHAWGLPDAIIDAVLDHHRPPRSVSGDVTLAAIIHAADLVVRDQDPHEDPPDAEHPTSSGLGAGSGLGVGSGTQSRG